MENTRRKVFTTETVDYRWRGLYIVSVPMARSFFGRWAVITGAIVSVIGLLGSAAPVVPSSYFLGLCQFLCVRLIALWGIWIGVLLLRYGQQLSTSFKLVETPA
jgi:hypothetical protein